MRQTPILSIIGRPNVGKSTLVNRLAGRKVCIVGEEAGITRDRKYIDFEYGGHPLTIVDTGGLSFNNKDDFSDEIYKQTVKGLKEADAIIFMVDVTAGITKLDDEIAKLLRKNEFVNESGKSMPVYVAVNKVDSPEREHLISEFYKLGFEEVYPISAVHGSRGLSDLLTKISERFSHKDLSAIEETQNLIKIAIVGKPNVGKSSLFNKLIGEERTIVSDISGTTRDAINIKLNRHEHQFELIDTAGLRRKSKVSNEVEKFSNVRATRSIAESDVSILVIDAGEENGNEEETITDQDQKIAALIESKGKACVVLVNKWDLVSERDQIALAKYKENLAYKLRFIDYAPVEYISVKTGKRTDKVWSLAIAANEQHKRRVATNLLNKVLGDILTVNPPPAVKQKSLKIKYVTQVSTAPPEFLFFTNYPDLVPDSYKRFLEKQLRQYFGFEGTPLRLRFSER